ncbi:MAG: hypothetical protein LBG72_07105, partial [Spirochaetaceae bacterium]|nr:hypothetical protein [Spirochaetaceae bacterium]
GNPNKSPQNATHFAFFLWLLLGFICILFSGCEEAEFWINEEAVRLVDAEYKNKDSFKLTYKEANSEYHWKNVDKVTSSLEFLAKFGNYRYDKHQGPNFEGSSYYVIITVKPGFIPGDFIQLHSKAGYANGSVGFSVPE